MKKLLAFFITLIITMGISSLICYASEYDDYIEMVNNKYGLSIEKNKSVEDSIEFSDFKKDVDKIAYMHIQNEQEIQRYEMLKPIPTLDEFIINEKLAAATYKTVTRKKHADSIFDIKVTYDYCTTSPYRVSNFRNISWHWQLISLFESFTPNSGYPTVTLRDSSRSGYIVYVGKYANASATDPNYRFAAEFCAPV